VIKISEEGLWLAKSMAAAVVFMASPAASLIAGETILIDGGGTAR